MEIMLTERSFSHMATHRIESIFFFFNDTATTEIYTLSLHDALPISHSDRTGSVQQVKQPLFMDCWNTPLNLQTGCSGPTTSFPTPWTTCASWPALLQPRRLATVSIHSAARQIQDRKSVV